jgi:lipopolysaccharide/colanic/teichoic acid biosynthesis glycosyltransferase
LASVLSDQARFFQLRGAQTGEDIWPHQANNPPLKQELELEYIQKRSLVFDLQLFFKFIWAHIVSGGNVKARGKPDPALEDG